MIFKKNFFQNSPAHTIDEFRKKLQRNPDDLRMRQKLADAYIKCGRIHDAINELDQLADRYNKEGFLSRSMALYKTILKLDPALSEIRLKLASLHKKEGLVADAHEQYHELVNREISKGRGDFDASEIEKISNIAPGDEDLLVAIAETLHEKGFTYEGCRKFFSAAKKCFESDNVKKAEEILKTLLEVDPDHKDGQIMMTVIKERKRENPSKAGDISNDTDEETSAEWTWKDWIKADVPERIENSDANATTLQYELLVKASEYLKNRLLHKPLDPVILHILHDIFKETEHFEDLLEVDEILARIYRSEDNLEDENKIREEMESLKETLLQSKGL